jgi:hypothetical protein
LKVTTLKIPKREKYIMTRMAKLSDILTWLKVLMVLTIPGERWWKLMMMANHLDYMRISGFGALARSHGHHTTRRGLIKRNGRMFRFMKMESRRL